MGQCYWVTYSSTLSYKGSWKNGLFEGQGELKYSNATNFIDTLTKGFKHGKGILVSSTGYRYKGDWVGGKKTGFATIHYKNGDVLTRGEMRYSDSSIYLGNLKDFIRYGAGSLRSSSGDCIDGIWVDNLNVHKATKKDENGVYWKGNLRNLKPQGYMHVRIPNGQEYDGLWENGNMLRAVSVKNKTGQVSPYHVH